MMMIMQYTNCVVKVHKVQTVKLTLYFMTLQPFILSHFSHFSHFKLLRTSKS